VVAGALKSDMEENPWKGDVSMSGLSSGWISREIGEITRLSSLEAAAFGWSIGSKFLTPVPDDVAKIQILAVSIIEGFLLEAGVGDLPVFAGIEADTTAGVGMPLMTAGPDAHIEAFSLACKGLSFANGFNTPITAQWSGPRHSGGWVGTALWRRQPRVTDREILGFNKRGRLAKIGVAGSVMPKIRLAINSPKVPNYILLLLNTAIQMVYSRGAKKGEAWAEVFKHGSGTSMWMNRAWHASTGIGRRLWSTDWSEFDISLLPVGIRGMMVLMYNWAKRSGWPEPLLEDISIALDIMPGLPIVGEGFDVMTHSVYGYDRPMERGLSSGIGLTSIVGTWMNMGIREVVFSGASTKREALEAGRRLCRNVIDRQRFIKVQGDDVVDSERIDAKEGGLDGEFSPGVEFLKMNLFTDKRGAVRVTPLFATTAISLVAEERGGRDSWMVSSGVPSTQGDRGNLNRVKMASGLSARSSVLAANPRGHQVFDVLTSCLQSDPDWDTAWGRVLNVPKASVLLSRLIKNPRLFGQIDSIALESARALVGADLNQPAQTMLAKLLDAYRVYSPNAPELQTAVDEALAGQRIKLTFPVSSMINRQPLVDSWKTWDSRAAISFARSPNVKDPVLWINPDGDDNE
jgi:hypothetical protein